MKTLLTFLLLADVTLSNAQYLETKAETSSQSIQIMLPDDKRPCRPAPRSLASSIRMEVASLADRLPDLAVSWLGVSCYVRNPLRFKLSPGSTYPHQIGVSSGNWFLSIDGIRTNTLEDVDIALQYPLGTKIKLFVRYADMQYKLDLYAFGKMPWE